MVILAGIRKSLLLCQPALSITTTACTPSSKTLDISDRNKFIQCVFAVGIMYPTLLPLAGQTAPNM